MLPFGFRGERFHIHINNDSHLVQYFMEMAAAYFYKQIVSSKEKVTASHLMLR